VDQWCYRQNFKGITARKHFFAKGVKKIKEPGGNHGKV